MMPALNNQLLIAMPSLETELFRKSVIYVCEHNEEGAVGLIINHPIQYPLQFVFEQMEIEVKIPEVSQKPLLFGGPVHQERGFVIHGNDHVAWRSSLKMSEEVYITTSHDILTAIAQGKGPQETLVVLGYAGWGAGQIEEELANNIWLTCPVTRKLLFEVPFENRWKAAGASLGIDMDLISGIAGHA